MISPNYVDRKHCLLERSLRFVGKVGNVQPNIAGLKDISFVSASLTAGIILSYVLKRRIRMTPQWNQTCLLLCNNGISNSYWATMPMPVKRFAKQLNKQQSCSCLSSTAAVARNGKMPTAGLRSKNSSR